MRKFLLGHDGETPINLDLDLALKGRLLVQASSGAGKSETVKKICYATKEEIQSIIVDPESEYAPLRSEMPFLLVGQGGEIPATLETAELVAHRLLETGASAILSLLELGHNRREWTRRFLVALDTAPKELRRETLLFVDEAHIFAMEQGNALDAVGMSVADIASRGRKRGIGLVVVTQRLALLSNHIIGLCENILIGRTGLLDAPRTAKLFAKTGAEGRDFIKQLGRIGDGQFYAYGRAFGLLDPTLFQVERVPGQTLAKASKHGKREAPPTPEEIKKLLPRFADLPAEAKKKADTEESLRADLKLALRQLEEAKRAGNGPRLDTEEVRKMKAQLETLEAGIRDAKAQHAQDVRQRESALKMLRSAHELIIGVERALQATPGSEQGMSALTTAAVETRAKMAELGRQPVPRPLAATPVAPRPATAELPDGEAPVSLPEQKVLNALGWFADLGIMDPDAASVAFMAGYKPTGGAFGSPRASLFRRQWITDAGRGKLALTDAGRGFVQDSGIERTNAGIQRAVSERFGEAERKVLAPLLECYPESMAASHVATAAGYKPTGGAFGGPRANLSRAGVITVPSSGMLRAADLLFPEGRR